MALMVVAFDIETGSAEDLHRYGPGFIRLSGWAECADGAPVRISTDPAELVDALMSADALTAHNGINFDLLALASQGHVTFDQYEALCLKTFDTLIAERHVNPVAARGRQPRGYYGLHETAGRYGVTGKDTVDFEGKRAVVRRVRGDREADRLKAGKSDSFSVLKVLADLYGGFDKIPQDDPDYRKYLAQDVTAQRGLFRALSERLGGMRKTDRAYVRREHYTQASMGRTTLEGCRTDVDLTMKRWSAGQARLDAGRQKLHAEFGMPLEGKKPHATNAGKAAFRAALLSTGIREDVLDEFWPKAKDGSLLTGKDVLNQFLAIFTEGNRNPAAAELCRTILAMNGERSIYGTMLDHIVGDRVHPYIGADQGSGRWSMKDPGMTVFGKRGGKAAERAVVLADTDDEVLVAVDADQVDARVIAAECQDPEYMKLFEPGMDLHSEVAFRVWPHRHQHGDGCHRNALPGCDCGVKAKCHCELRDRAKVFGHGFSYGLGARGMARQHGVDIAVAEEFIRGMTEAFPRLAAWKEETRQAAGVLGFDEVAPLNDTYRILHTWAGRPVRVEREQAYTQATAMIGQGGTRDVMAHAILNLPKDIRRRVRAVIHDEIVLSLPKTGAQEAAQRIADGMAFSIRGVDITFGCSRVSPNWAGCYGEQYETAA